MPYTRQAVTLCFLMLFLQASRCKSSRNDQPDLGPLLIERKEEEDFDDEDTQDEGYVSDDEGSSADTDTDTESIGGEVDFDFEEQIQALRIAADANRGIRCKILGDSMKREVVDSGNSLYTAADYAIQILNICRAAKKICLLYEKDGAVFSKMAYKFMEFYAHHATEPEDFWIKKLKNINHRVVLKLHKMAFLNENAGSINDKLRLAENYVGLDDTHYDVTTTFDIEGKKFALEDKKWLPLIAKQKRAYLDRKSQIWYKRLDPFEQKFIDAYLDKFLDGKHYIPTQLRDIIGSRNAYKKNVWHFDKNGNKMLLGHYYHSGSLASPNERTDQESIEADCEITQQNWEQVQEQDKNVEVLSLNYEANIPVFDQLRERKIVEDTRKVVEQKNGRFMNLSTNLISTSYNVKPSINKLITESLNFYKKKYPILYKTFRKGTKENRKAQIDQIEDPKDKAYFNVLEQLKAFAESSEGYLLFTQNINQKDNYYADIAAKYIACKGVSGQVFSNDFLLFFCKSGKDRTGYMSLLVDAMIICMRFPDLDLPTVYTALVYASQYQSLAAINGGMPGRFGMKSVRTTKESDSFTNLLFPKAAQHTQIPLGKQAVETIE